MSRRVFAAAVLAFASQLMSGCFCCDRPIFWRHKYGGGCCCEPCQTCCSPGLPPVGPPPPGVPVYGVGPLPPGIPPAAPATAPANNPPIDRIPTVSSTMMHGSR